jgi:hypothetical protein
MARRGVGSFVVKLMRRDRCRSAPCLSGMGMRDLHFKGISIRIGGPSTQRRDLVELIDQSLKERAADERKGGGGGMVLDLKGFWFC